MSQVTTQLRLLSQALIIPSFIYMTLLAMKMDDEESGMDSDVSGICGLRSSRCEWKSGQNWCLLWLDWTYVLVFMYET